MRFTKGLVRLFLIVGVMVLTGALVYAQGLYGTDFEGSVFVVGNSIDAVDGWKVWQEESRANPIVVANEGVGGGKAIKVSGAGKAITIVKDLGLSGDEGEVWIDLQMKVLGTLSDIVQFYICDQGAANVGTLVRITADGHRVIASNGNLIGGVTWVSSPGNDMKDGEWHRLTFHQNMKSGRYNVYFDEKEIFSDFGFRHAGGRTKAGWIWIMMNPQIGDAGYLLDNLKVSTAKPF